MFVNLLPAAVFLPLVATVYFAASGSGKNIPEGRPVDLGGRSLVFSWIFAALATLAGIAGLRSEAGLAVSGPIVRLGVSGFEVEPRLFLDGRNALFLILLGLCYPIVFTFLRDREGRYGKSHYICAWALAFSLAGVFTADSLLLFYLFWEAALIAVYFWIGLHGKTDVRGNEVYPTLLRFVLFTLAGSLPMLLSVAAVCASNFSDPGIQGLAASVAQLPDSTRLWVFLGFFLGFAVKLPLLGFHGWLRNTYNVAPPACRALLSAAMSKMGAFGLILVLAPAFPGELARFAPALQALAVAGALYGGLLMLAQDRLVDLLAYASLSHLSLLALGVFTSVDGPSTTGLSGAVLLVFNHAIIMVLLFALDSRILKGAVTGGASPDRGLLSGLRAGQKRLFAFLLLAVFASASLPGLSNFPGEILIYFSAFKVSPWLTVFAGLGALLGAAALVRALHNVFLGKPAAQSDTPLREGMEPAADLSLGESALAFALGVVWLVLGLAPMLLLGPVEKAFSYINSMGWMG
jgi:NADH-quinone oxidoreductase subunit M